MNGYFNYKDELYHYGVLGMKWGVRRYQDYGKGGYNPKKTAKKLQKAMTKDNVDYYNPSDSVKKELSKVASNIKKEHVKQIIELSKKNHDAYDEYIKDKTPEFEEAVDYEELEKRSFNDAKKYYKEMFGEDKYKALVKEAGGEDSLIDYYDGYFDSIYEACMDENWEQMEKEYYKEHKEFERKLDAWTEAQAKYRNACSKAAYDILKDYGNIPAKSTEVSTYNEQYYTVNKMLSDQIQRDYAVLDNRTKTSKVDKRVYDRFV